ncbi:MAG: fused MFS/spermidine synthase [Bryobacterales bacterium]|nr:fused MFS/spermidine synthase [Bryobacterales bacterium]
MLPYTLAILLGAFLLFQVQPIMAKVIMPWFGGSASVWAACMLFFQVFLLLGYIYAHLSIRFLRPRAQALLHGALLAASLLLLRIVPDAAWKPTGSDNPVLKIATLLAAGVGLPYFLLATTGPLMQAWYARSHQAALPYRLFAVSNFGSLLALVSYPILVEPKLATSRQALVWSLAYGVFCLASCFCAWRSLKPAPAAVASLPAAGNEEIGPSVYAEAQTATPDGITAPAAGHGPAGEAEPEPEPAIQEPQAPPWHAYVLWTLLAACSSTLLLAVTNYVCQNIAPVPFLWILPLSLYLITFILAFAHERIYQPGIFLGLLALALSAMTYGLAKFDGATELLHVVPLFTAALFICCLVCHGELARRKPHARYLTGFYLAIALGGALGGIFVGGFAPYIFSGYFEMPLAVFFCAALGLWIYRKAHRGTYAGWAFLTIVLALTLYVQERDVARRARFMGRNFYGALRVTQDGDLKDPFATRTLVNGTITHGVQYLSEQRRRFHTTYYGAGSGVGLAIRNTRRSSQRVGVIGLGTGTIASYGRPGDYYRFYDINSLVVEVARREFTYLMDCEAKVDLALGDARLSLEREPNQDFDVLAVDAFTSDMIPVHLLTIEAFRTYFRHIRPDGVLAVHVSNRHLELEPVVQLAANALGKVTRLVDTSDGDDLVYGATWVLVSANPGVFSAPDYSPYSKPIRIRPGLRLWTDDYSNLWQILQLRP